MANVMLISSEYIKNYSNIDDNMPEKLFKPAILNAQERSLREILGDRLINKIKDVVEEGEIDTVANRKYKNLLIQCQPFLCYTVLAEIIVFTAAKISPAGIEQVSDERMNPLAMEDVFQLQNYYQKKADFECMKLQEYVYNNRTLYPELTQEQGAHIVGNLYSAASSGLWLGGERGKNRKNKIKLRYIYK